MKTSSKHVFKSLFISFALIGCNQTNNREVLLEKELELAKKELALEKEKQSISQLKDSIKSELKSKVLFKSDTTQKENLKEESQIVNRKTNREQNQKEKKEKPTKPIVEQNEPKFFYYDTRQLSVKINAWDNGRQKIELYDKQGNKTYELENIKLSFHQSNKLTFHKNGTLESTFIKLNPGASRYWYETTIQFDENNNPLNKVSKQMPAESVLDAMGKTYLWKTQKKDWILQETMQCQPINIK